MTDQQVDRGISGHYTPMDLGAALRSVLDGLRATGKDPDALTPDDLAPVD